MKNGRNRTLKDIGELAVIERICKFLRYGRKIITGIGDDCAVVRQYPNGKNDLLLTSDAVIEGIHFHPRTPFAEVGYKAMARVLSDIAAMGGNPGWALIDLVAPQKMKIQSLDAIYSGATRIACKYGLAIVGGDTASGRMLELHVFAVGTVPKGKAILRSGAKPGDTIFVTGTLGGSSMGKHLHFTPRLKEGIFLRKWATSMIDISDGLASDLMHLTVMSKTGAVIDAPSIPISKAASRLKDNISPLDHSMYDGEDFELLLTVPVKNTKAFLLSWKQNFALPCTKIGIMTGRQGTIEYTDNNGMAKKLDRTGYQHFKE